MHESQQVEILSQLVEVRESQSIEKKLSKNQDSRNLILLKLELRLVLESKLTSNAHEAHQDFYKLNIIEKKTPINNDDFM